MLEHLGSEDEYIKAGEYVREIAREVKVSL
jgi:hypothetical protein